MQRSHTFLQLRPRSFDYVHCVSDGIHDGQKIPHGDGHILICLQDRVYRPEICFFEFLFHGVWCFRQMYNPIAKVFFAKISYCIPILAKIDFVQLMYFCNGCLKPLLLLNTPYCIFVKR